MKVTNPKKFSNPEYFFDFDPKHNLKPNPEPDPILRLKKILDKILQELTYLFFDG